jgi:ATP-dependent Lon protease
VLAAHRAGIKTFILPKRNLNDLEEIPPEVLKELRFIPVEHMDEVIQVALHALPLSQEELEKPERRLRPIKPARVRRAPVTRTSPAVPPSAN